MSKQSPAAFNWVFTLNNPDVEDEQALIDQLPYRYLIYQHELGESGTHHIQGYFVLDKRMRRTALSKILGHAHLEIRRGTHEEAKAYCSKEDSRMVGTLPVEWGSEEGIAKGRGARSDLTEIKAKIDAGASQVQIWDEHFSSSVRYHKAFEVYRQLKSKHREWLPGEKPRVIVWWGKTRVGKSRRAAEEFPNAYWLNKPSSKNGTLWWSGYQGQDTVVIDEFYGWIQYDVLLRYLDFTKVEVELKGSTYKLAAKTWIITSNKPPTDWYKNIDTSALMARLSPQEFGTVEEMTLPYDFSTATSSSPVEVQDGYISEEL